MFGPADCWLVWLHVHLNPYKTDCAWPGPSLPSNGGGGDTCLIRFHWPAASLSAARHLRRKRQLRLLLACTHTSTARANVQRCLWKWNQWQEALLRRTAPTLSWPEQHLLSQAMVHAYSSVLEMLSHEQSISPYYDVKRNPICHEACGWGPRFDLV